MDTSILKASQIIYGAGRLNMAVTSLTEWLATASIRNAAEALRVNLECAQIRDGVKLLLHASSDLRDLAPLDTYLSDTRRLHFELAQVIEDVGYPGVPPAFLRDHAQRLTLP